jgi:ABC-type branched-subunit amino acid transport system permease subunit
MLEYLYEVLTLVAIFGIASVGLALIVAQAGLLTLAHGGFVGLGAYTYSLIAVSGTHPLLALLAAILLCSAAAALLGNFISNLVEEQFAVVTLAFSVLFVNVATNWVGVTNGSYGVSQIPRLTFADTRIAFLLFCAFLAVLTLAAVSMLARSGFGILLRASANDKDVVEGLGVSVVRLRVQALAIGSGLAGLAGALFAMHSAYIAPQLFELHLSILIVAMVIIGGTGSPVSALLGAALLVVVPEALRFAAFSPASAGPLRQVVFGSLLLLVVFLQARRRSWQG